MSDLTAETSFLVPILILLGAAVVFAPVFRIAGLGSVIGYLAAGMAIGPSGLGLIADPRLTLNISQLGVVLLLFLIGLRSSRRACAPCGAILRWWASARWFSPPR